MIRKSCVSLCQPKNAKTWCHLSASILMWIDKMVLWNLCLDDLHRRLAKSCHTMIQSLTLLFRWTLLAICLNLWPNHSNHRQQLALLPLLLRLSCLLTALSRYILLTLFSINLLNVSFFFSPSSWSNLVALELWTPSLFPYSSSKLTVRLSCLVGLILWKNIHEYFRLNGKDWDEMLWNCCFAQFLLFFDFNSFSFRLQNRI